ncbi:MAG: hypothetical protein Q3972_08005 [Corynebacterium sp.]|nr:hypothetical protein [Corynebacterium sp.]
MKKLHRNLLAIGGAALMTLGAIAPAQAIEMRLTRLNGQLVCESMENNDEYIAMSRLANFEVSFNVFNGIKERLNQQHTRDAYIRYVDAMIAVAQQPGWNPQTEYNYNLGEWNDLYNGTFGAFNAGYNEAWRSGRGPGETTLHFNTLMREVPNFSIPYGSDSWGTGNAINTDPINHQAYVTMFGREYLLPNDDDRNIQLPQHQVVEDACNHLVQQKDASLYATIALNPRLMLWSNNDYAYWRNLLLARDILVAAGRPTTLVDGPISRVQPIALKLEQDADAARVEYDRNIDKQRWFHQGDASFTATSNPLAALSSQFGLSSTAG